jgi:hypothetical protein
MKTLEAMHPEYVAQVAAHWDWAKVRATCESNAKNDPSRVENGKAEGLCYLGSILNISPSGKVYTPWANGNVRGCPACTDGKMPRPKRARFWRKKSFERLKRREAQLFDDASKHNGLYCEWPRSLQTKMQTVRDRIAALTPTTHCIYCNGMGSREAALDEVWREALEAEASKHGLTITGSEGDGCDVCAGMVIDVEDAAEDIAATVDE